MFFTFSICNYKSVNIISKPTETAEDKINKYTINRLFIDLFLVNGRSLTPETNTHSVKNVATKANKFRKKFKSQYLCVVSASEY